MKVQNIEAEKRYDNELENFQFFQIESSFYLYNFILINLEYCGGFFAIIFILFQDPKELTARKFECTTIGQQYYICIVQL